jgi:hypothetical protein
MAEEKSGMEGTESKHGEQAVTRRKVLETLGGVAAVGAGIVLAARPAAAEAVRTDAASANPPLEGVSTSANEPGVTGENTAQSGFAIAVLGTSTSPDGVGVGGLNAATSGDTTGVLGAVSSPDGTGVAGFNNTKSGDTTGVYGEVASPDGVGVAGVNGIKSGHTTGVYGKASSPYGIGVEGLNDAKSGLAYGVYGESASSYAIAVGGLSTAASGDTTGVYGEVASPDGTGVEGRNDAKSGNAWGVYGVVASPDGVGVEGLNTATRGDTAGVRGDVKSPDGAGVLGINDAMSGDGAGVEGKSSSHNGAAVVGSNLATIGRSIGVYGETGSKTGFGVFCSGNFAATGTKAAAVPFPDGTVRALYCVESPECWFEDFGLAELVDGVVQVPLDPDFAATVRTDQYYVFVEPEADCHGLYVTAKDSQGFTVRELQGGTATIPFSYRVVARRKDVEAPRFAEVDLPSRLSTPADRRPARGGDGVRTRKRVGGGMLDAAASRPAVRSTHNSFTRGGDAPL